MKVQGHVFAYSPRRTRERVPVFFLDYLKVSQFPVYLVGRCIDKSGLGGMISDGFQKVKSSLGVGFKIRKRVFQTRCDRDLTCFVSDPFKGSFIDEELIQFVFL